MKNNFLPLYDLTPFTMQDFPDRTACIVWLAGCNMRCGYCHNPDIVRGGCGKIKKEDVFSFLEKRKGLLEGVVLSGGEAALYKGIIPFARDIKKMGFAVKLDTNGTRPATVRQMLEENLLDYVAMDYKAPEEKFRQVTACGEWASFSETLDLLIRQKTVPVEIRTTVHKDLLNEKDVQAIAYDLKKRGFSGKYYIQNYRSPPQRSFMDLSPDYALNIKDVFLPPELSVELRNFPI